MEPRKRKSLPNIWAPQAVDFGRPEYHRDRSRSRSISSDHENMDTSRDELNPRRVPIPAFETFGIKYVPKYQRKRSGSGGSGQRSRAGSLTSDHEDVDAKCEDFNPRRVSLPAYSSTGKRYGPKPRSIKDVFKLYQAKIGFENGFEASRFQSPQQNDQEEEVEDLFPVRMGRRHIPISRKRRSYSVMERSNVKTLRNPELSINKPKTDGMRDFGDRRYSAPIVNKPSMMKPLNWGSKPRSIKDVFKLYQAKVGFLNGFQQGTPTGEDIKGISYRPQLEHIDSEECSINEETNLSEGNLSDYIGGSVIDEDVHIREDGECDVHSPLLEHDGSSNSPFRELAREKENISLSPWKPPSPYGYQGNYNSYSSKQGMYHFLFTN